MRDPTGGNVIGLDNVPFTSYRIIGFILAILFFVIVLGYLIAVA
jgi:hypothetical protein